MLDGLNTRSSSSESSLLASGAESDNKDITGTAYIFVEVAELAHTRVQGKEACHRHPQRTNQRAPYYVERQTS